MSKARALLWRVHCLKESLQELVRGRYSHLCGEPACVSLRNKWTHSCNFQILLTAHYSSEALPHLPWTWTWALQTIKAFLPLNMERRNPGRSPSWRVAEPGLGPQIPTSEYSFPSKIKSYVLDGHFVYVFKPPQSYEYDYVFGIIYYWQPYIYLE